MNITTDDLYEFGKWARDNRNHLAPKSQWYELIMKGNVEQPIEDISYNMTDEKADKIDKAVCALCNYNALLGQVFVGHYLYTMTYRQLAKECQINKDKVACMLSEAGGFVIGHATST